MNYKLLFWDFEVKKDWWCVTFCDEQDNYITFESGQELDLRDFIIKHQADYVFIGYNNVWFDNWCLKAVWYGINPYKVVYHCIELGEKPWEIEELKFKKNLPLKSFDIFQAIGRSAPSLKDIEAHLGIEIITDSSLEVNKWEGLTRQEKDTVIAYNHHDVFATKLLFEFFRGEYESIWTLIETFHLDPKVLSKPKAQMLECICKDYITKKLSPYEFQYKAPSFIKLLDNTVKMDMEKQVFTIDNDYEYELMWDGYVYKFGRGGAHYAIKNYIQKLDDDHMLVCNDFDSFYPNMMANSKNPELRFIDPVLPYLRFRELIDLRVNSKKAGNKKLADGLKIPCNGAYGKLIDKFSKLSFWPSGLSVCLTGQLITLMICQALRKEGIGKLINVNTDGFYYEIRKDELEKFNKIMSDFENEIGITFSRDIIKNGRICQKDVNNYVIYDADTGKVKVKGDLVKRYNTKVKYTSYSTAIVDEAIVKQLVWDIPIEKTILDAFNNNEAIKFQLVYNMKGKNWEGCYECWFKDDEETIPYKVNKVQRINRGFASSDKSLPQLRRLKSPTYHKFDDKPNHVYIYNKDLKDLDIRKICLDVNWYIDLAKKGYKQFIGGKK